MLGVCSVLGVILTKKDLKQNGIFKEFFENESLALTLLF